MKIRSKKIGLMVTVGAFVLCLLGCSSSPSLFSLDKLLNSDAESLEKTLIESFGERNISTEKTSGTSGGSGVSLVAIGNPEGNPVGDQCMLTVSLDANTYNPDPNFFEYYSNSQYARMASLTWLSKIDDSLWDTKADEIQKACGFSGVIGEDKSGSVAGRESNTNFKHWSRYGKCKINNEDAIWKINFWAANDGNAETNMIEASVEPLGVTFDSYDEIEELVK